MDPLRARGPVDAPRARPLTAEQSDELIDELLQVEALPGPVRRRIGEKTDGNPLFVQEVARALIDRGVVEQTADGRRLAGDVTDVAIPTPCRA